MSATRIRLIQVGVVVLGLAFIGLGLPGSPVWKLFKSEPEGTTISIGSGGTGATQDADGSRTSSTPSAVRDLQIITVLPQDAIRAILDPIFITAEEANEQMTPSELVLGLSINGEHHAYSVPLLSVHEVVNDTVGGVPVGVTW